jgi:AcrR family transcriptional regulator
MRGLTAEERRRQRRRRLLDAALELFTAQSYATVTVDLVCQVASVSTKSFYADFANKEELFIELYDELIQRAKDAVLTVDLAGLDEDARTRARLAAFVHACVDDPRVALVCFLEAPGLTAAIDARRRTVHHEFATYVESLAGPYLAAGRRPPSGHYRLGAVAVVGAIKEVIIDWVLDPDPAPVEAVIDGLADFLALVRAPVTGHGRGRAADTSPR